MAEFQSSPVTQKKFNELKNALNTFLKSMALNLGCLNDELLVDTVKNGQIQRFEYSLELLWKFLKYFLKEDKGIIVGGPKDALRQYAQFSKLSPKQIQETLEMIDSRNSIAHEYKDYIMCEVYPQLNRYLSLMELIFNEFEISDVIE